MTVIAQSLFSLLVGLAICAALATQRLNDRGFFHKRAYSRAPKNSFARETAAPILPPQS